MSLWQFMACVDGWTRANGGGGPEAPSEDEFDALLAAHEGL